MTRVLLLGASFEDLDPGGTPLARGEVEFVHLHAGDEAALASISPPPSLVLVDVRSVGERTAGLLAAIRAAYDPEATATLLLVPALERELWAAAGADGIVNRPLTAARLLEALKRHGSIEERQSERGGHVLKIELSSGGKEWTGFTRDVGSTGVFVHGRAPFVRGEEISFRLVLPGEHGPEPLEGNGRVVRVERERTGDVEGAAVEFVGLSASQRRRLGRWLRDRRRVST